VIFFLDQVGSVAEDFLVLAGFGLLVLREALLLETFVADVALDPVCRWAWDASGGDQAFDRLACLRVLGESWFADSLQNFEWLSMRSVWIEDGVLVQRHFKFLHLTIWIVGL
jgi:hypothetical protein